ncbi:MAG: two-component regulator propeller domain-containing protein [bacterium]
MKSVITIFLTLFFNILFSNITLHSQNPEWISYTKLYCYSILIDEDYIWAGGIGLIKIDKSTGEVEFFNNLNSELPDLYVSAIAKDSIGMIWFGTSKGIAVFDGENWEVYNIENSELCDNQISDLTCDNQGRMWVGTAKGISVFEFNQFLDIVDYFGKNWEYYVRDIEIDKTGNVFVGLNNFLSSYNSNGYEIIHLDFFDERDRQTSAICFDSSNTLWITNGKSFAKFDGNNWKVFEFQHEIYSLTFDNDNFLWIANEWGIAKFDIVNEIFITENIPGYKYSVSDIKFDGSDLYYGTRSGLVQCTENDTIIFRDYNSNIPDNWVSSVIVDGINQKWISNQGLISIFDGVNFEIQPDIKGSNKLGEGFILDKKGHIWIVTPGSLSTFKDGNWITYKCENMTIPYNSRVHSAVFDNSNILWVATNQGLVEFDGINWVLHDTTNSILSDNYIGGLAVDSSNILWIFTRENIINVDGTNWTTLDSSFNPIQGIFETDKLVFDKENVLWVASGNDNLQKFDGFNWTLYDSKNSILPYTSVTSIAVDDRNIKWIGTWAGLLKIDGENWSIFTSQNSDMPNSQVNSIATDQYGNKWMGSTFGGLMVFREGGVILKTEDNTRNKSESVQCYPNPFSESTTIKYYLVQPTFVNLKVFDTYGRELANLENNFLNEGEHQVRFDAGNLPDGIYYYKLISADRVEFGKMMLIR